MVRYPSIFYTGYFILATFSVLLAISPIASGAAADGSASRSRIQMINSLAQSGHADAQYTLGHVYLSGKGLEKDIIKGVYWLEKAAEQGHAASQNRLGLVYTGHDDSVIDCRLATRWFIRVGRDSKLYRQAQGNLAWILATCPNPVYRDGQRAIEIIRGLLEIDNQDNPLLLDTLAAAYAETGQFQRAIDTQSRALQSLDPHTARPQQQERFAARLHTYRQHRPWRLVQANESTTRP